MAVIKSFKQSKFALIKHHTGFSTRGNVAYDLLADLMVLKVETEYEGKIAILLKADLSKETFYFYFRHNASDFYPNFLTAKPNLSKCEIQFQATPNEIYKLKIPTEGLLTITGYYREDNTQKFTENVHMSLSQYEQAN
jgi:hypothetical protein